MPAESTSDNPREFERRYRAEGPMLELWHIAGGSHSSDSAIRLLWRPNGPPEQPDWECYVQFWLGDLKSLGQFQDVLDGLVEIEQETIDPPQLRHVEALLEHLGFYKDQHGHPQ